MAQSQEAPGRRFVPAGWRDPRLLVGVVLVVVSVLGVVLLVNSLQKTQPVYAAARDVGTGERVTEADLKVVQVRLGDAAAGYLSAEGPPGPELRALSALREGELVPLRALGREGEERRPIALRLEGSTPPGVRVGSRVDVYVSSAPSMSQSQEAPRRVLQDLEVLAIAAVQGGLGSGELTEIQVLVPPDQVQTAVSARTAERLDIVAGAVSP